MGATRRWTWCTRSASAGQALAAVVLPDELPGYIGWNYVLIARGRIHAARGDFSRACDDFAACGARQERWGAHNPSVIAWRSSAALAHHALGHETHALELADEELASLNASAHREPPGSPFAHSEPSRAAASGSNYSERRSQCSETPQTGLSMRAHSPTSMPGSAAPYMMRPNERALC